MSRIPISTKVLVQAASAALLVILNALGADTEWVKELPGYIAPIVIVALPAALAWLKRETNPPETVVANVRSELLSQGWTPPDVPPPAA